MSHSISVLENEIDKITEGLISLLMQGKFDHENFDNGLRLIHDLTESIKILESPVEPVMPELARSRRVIDVPELRHYIGFKLVVKDAFGVDSGISGIIEKVETDDMGVRSVSLVGADTPIKFEAHEWVEVLGIYVTINALKELTDYIGHYMWTDERSGILTYVSDTDPSRVAIDGALYILTDIDKESWVTVWIP